MTSYKDRLYNRLPDILVDFAPNTEAVHALVERLKEDNPSTLGIAWIGIKAKAKSDPTGAMRDLLLNRIVVTERWSELKMALVAEGKSALWDKYFA